MTSILLSRDLPLPPVPIGNYVATRVVKDQLFVSGQLPIYNGELLYRGKLGAELSVAQGKLAAELSAMNLISQINSHVGLDRFESIIRLDGFINASDDFTQHADVLNGASDALATAFSGSPLPIRTVIGCNGLPLGAAVELSVIAQLKD